MPSTQPMDYNLMPTDYLGPNESFGPLDTALLGNQNPPFPPLGPSGLADHFDVECLAGWDDNNLWDLTPTYSKTSNTPSLFPQEQNFPHSGAPNVSTNGVIPQTSQRTFSAETQEVLPTQLPTPLPTPRTFNDVQDEEKPKVKLRADRNKTRAETQILLHLILDPLSSRFRRVHFPKKTLAKPKHYANEQEKADFAKDGETLFMDVFLVLATAVEKEEQRLEAFKRARGDSRVYRRPANVPLTDLDKADLSHPQNGGEVIICQGCKEREEKRYNRKKKKSLEDEREWERYKNDRAIIINEKEYKNFKDVEPEHARSYQTSPIAKMVTLHMRIACYCRHQEEKSPLGYRVIFTFKDSHGKLVTQHMSEIFQITDDHKNKDFVAEYPWNSASAPQLTSVSRPGPTQYPKPAGRAPPSLVSPNNMVSQAPYPYSLAMPTYSQPTTPIAPTFQTPISPIQTTFPQTPTAITPLIHDFQFATITPSNISTSVRAPVHRTPSLIDNTAFFPNTATTTNMQQHTPPETVPYNIPRVASLDTFQFHQQQMQMQMRYSDYASAPQSSSTTPITQSRPASPTWEQNAYKRTCYTGTTGFSLACHDDIFHKG